MKISIIGLLILLSAACNQQTDLDNHAQKKYKKTACSFQDFVHQNAQNKAGQRIDSCFHLPFIKPAVHHIEYLAFCKEALFFHGQNVYTDEQITVLSFYYDAKWGQSVAKAAILASYSTKDGQCIDAVLQFASGQLQQQDSLYPLLGLSYRSEQEIWADSSIILTQKAVEKTIFKHSSGPDLEKNMHKRVQLHKDGRFEESVESVD